MAAGAEKNVSVGITSSAFSGVKGTSSVHWPPPVGPMWEQWTSGRKGTYLAWNSLVWVDFGQ